MAISLSAESVNSVKLSSVVVFRFALAFTKKVHVVVRNDHIAYLARKISQLFAGFYIRSECWQSMRSNNVQNDFQVFHFLAKTACHNMDYLLNRNLS